MFNLSGAWIEFKMNFSSFIQLEAAIVFFSPIILTNYSAKWKRFFYLVYFG